MLRLFPYKLRRRYLKPYLEIRCSKCHSVYNVDPKEQCIYSRFGNFLCAIEDGWQTNNRMKEEIDLLTTTASELFRLIDPADLNSCPYCGNTFAPGDKRYIQEKGEVYYLLW